MSAIRRGAPLVAGRFSSAWQLLRNSVRQIPSLGFIAAATLFLCEATTRKPISKVFSPHTIERVKVKPSGYGHPVIVRRVGTDRTVLSQMLVRREYAPVSSLPGINLIVDCGANIGLSAYYLLHCYPNARLIAIEPDGENCALCRRNLAPFADRVTILQAAVWPENRSLRIVPASRKDGAWSLEVEPWASGDVAGITIPEALRRAGARPPIDLLKMDIEGAEAQVFQSAPRWLDEVRNIAIELHGTDASAAFEKSLNGYRFTRQFSHELTIVYDLRASRT